MIKDNVLLVWAFAVLVIALYLYSTGANLGVGAWIS